MKSDKFEETTDAKKLIDQKKYKKGRSLYEKLYKDCEKNNNIEVCCNLAILYYEGLGGEKKYSDAYKMFKNISEEDTLAKLYLGRCYAYGNGVEKDTTEAVKIYKEIIAKESTYKRQANNKLAELYKERWLAGEDLTKEEKGDEKASNIIEAIYKHYEAAAGDTKASFADKFAFGKFIWELCFNGYKELKINNKKIQLTYEDGIKKIQEAINEEKTPSLNRIIGEIYLQKELLYSLQYKKYKLESLNREIKNLKDQKDKEDKNLEKKTTENEIEDLKKQIKGYNIFSKSPALKNTEGALYSCKQKIKCEEKRIFLDEFSKERWKYISIENKIINERLDEAEVILDYNDAETEFDGKVSPKFGNKNFIKYEDPEEILHEIDSFLKNETKNETKTETKIDYDNIEYKKIEKTKVSEYSSFCTNINKTIEHALNTILNVKYDANNLPATPDDAFKIFTSNIATDKEQLLMNKLADKICVSGEGGVLKPDPNIIKIIHIFSEDKKEENIEYEMMDLSNKLRTYTRTLRNPSSHGSESVTREDYERGLSLAILQKNSIFDRIEDLFGPIFEKLNESKKESKKEDVNLVNPTQTNTNDIQK